MVKGAFYIATLKVIVFLAIMAFTNPKIHSRLVPHKSKAMTEIVKMPAKVDGEGRPLILVPGGLTGWKSWEPFVENFKSKGRKVIRVQLINVEYGYENHALPAGYSVKTESGALAGTLDSLGIDQPVDFVAWSYGALVTLDYALDHPGKVRSLTLIEPPAIWILRDEGKLDSETRKTIKFFESLHGNISEDMLAQFLEEAGFVKPGQSPKELPQWQQWLPYRQSLCNSPAIVQQRDDLKRLRNFNHPVLIVKGTGSATFLHKIADSLASELPESQVTEMPAGHAPHIVSRDRFLSELGKFQDNHTK